MKANRAMRLQLAIHELIDALAEDISARMAAAITNQLATLPPESAGQRAPPQRNEPKPRLLKCPKVTARTGLSRTTIYVYMKRGTFPSHIKVGRSAVWLEADIDAWINEHLAAVG